jgi:hypothetical protein
MLRSIQSIQSIRRIISTNTSNNRLCINFKDSRSSHPLMKASPKTQIITLSNNMYTSIQKDINHLTNNLILTEKNIDKLKTWIIYDGESAPVPSNIQKDITHSEYFMKEGIHIVNATVFHTEDLPI